MKFSLHLIGVLVLSFVSVLGKSFEETELEILEQPKSSKKSNIGNWCEWWGDKPGRLYRSKDNPWIQSFRIAGRLNYQAATVEGNDVNGLDFNDSYDEFRRLRVETKTEFLKYFTTEVNLNLVNDTRFRRNTPDGSINFGDGPFDEVSLAFNIRKAFDLDFVDELSVKAGRMRVRLTEEGHTSSREIPTIERSSLEGILGGEARRPTGLLVEVEKGDWNLTFGAFNADDNDDLLSDWSEGVFYYGSLKLQATDNLKFILDYLHNDRSDSLATSGLSDALGFQRAGALSIVYERKRWGASLTGAYGTNGDERFELLPRRQGEFYGVVATPYYWLVKDRVQLVGQYQYLGSKESQGIQVRSRYLRAQHDNPLVDDDNGRGHRYHNFYGGINLYPCEENMRIMLGISYDNLATRDGGNIDALTYLVAFQTFF